MSQTSASFGPWAIRSIASPSSSPSPARFSAARVMMKGSMEFDHASPILTEMSVIFFQFSVHWAIASASTLAPPVCSVIAASLRFEPRAADASGRGPVSKGLGVDRKRILELDFARIVDEQPRLLHRVLGELVQVARANADVGERRRHLAVAADSGHRVNEQPGLLADRQSLGARIDNRSKFRIESLGLRQVETKHLRQHQRIR